MDNDKIVLRKSKELTNACKKIFGDIIICAYHSTYLTPDFTKEAKIRLDKSHFNIDENCLQYNNDIVIEFINGNKVQLWFSELAGFIFLKPENILMEEELVTEPNKKQQY